MPRCACCRCLSFAIVMSARYQTSMQFARWATSHNQTWIRHQSFRLLVRHVFVADLRHLIIKSQGREFLVKSSGFQRGNGQEGLECTRVLMIIYIIKLDVDSGNIKWQLSHNHCTQTHVTSRSSCKTPKPSNNDISACRWPWQQRIECYLIKIEKGVSRRLSALLSKLRGWVPLKLRVKITYLELQAVALWEILLRVGQG